MAWSNKPHVPYSQRIRIKRRDSYACQRCGVQDAPLEVNHIIPLAEGGDNSDDNLESLCVPCHSPETYEQTVRGHIRRAARGLYPMEKHPGVL